MRSCFVDTTNITDSIGGAPLNSNEDKILSSYRSEQYLNTQLQIRGIDKQSFYNLVNNKENSFVEIKQMQNHDKPEMIQLKQLYTDKNLLGTNANNYITSDLNVIKSKTTDNEKNKDMGNMNRGYK